ncbi:hypothetical protein Taro_041411 [Colocasia esculenta]|uniref:Glutaredoxin domain-containing protein n=1 Tax=Colocasia esculenta TaxID=4460 RepID=A0A843WPT1_COLES|nr:hypothetical protein [Colocasia esculenta]
MGRIQLMEEWCGQHEEDIKSGALAAAEALDRSPPLILSGGSVAAAYERVRRLASGNAVVVFSLSGCCMCHVVKRLLLGLGVGPAVYELDLEEGGADIQAVLYSIFSASSSATAVACRNGSPTGGAQSPPPPPSSSPMLPAVFVGGKLVGGLEAVMACHINGTLVPLLKDAGALWL